jgi:hypothetical protein
MTIPRTPEALHSYQWLADEREAAKIRAKYRRTRWTIHCIVIIAICAGLIMSIMGVAA